MTAKSASVTCSQCWLYTVAIAAGALPEGSVVVVVVVLRVVVVVVLRVVVVVVVVVVVDALHFVPDNSNPVLQLAQ